MDFTKVRELRKILGLTQAAICNEMDFSVRTWQGYDAKGKSARPGTKAKNKIIAYFYSKIDMIEDAIASDETKLIELEKQYKKMYNKAKNELLTTDIAQLEVSHSNVLECLKRIKKNRLDLIRYADILNEVHNEN